MSYSLTELYTLCHGTTVNSQRTFVLDTCWTSWTVSSQSLNIFFMWFLERFKFTMLVYPCRCVIGSHVSSVLSYLLQQTFYRVVFTLPSSTWQWKFSPIPTSCSGIHCIEPSFCCTNAWQSTSKYDVDVHSEIIDCFCPWVRLGIPIDSGMDLSIRIDKLRMFINKTLSTQSLINQLNISTRVEQCLPPWRLGTILGLRWQYHLRSVKLESARSYVMRMRDKLKKPKKWKTDRTSIEFTDQFRPVKLESVRSYE